MSGRTDSAAQPHEVEGTVPSQWWLDLKVENQRLRKSLDALALAFRWIAPLPEGRPDSQATCAYVPREVYDRLKEAVDA